MLWTKTILRNIFYLTHRLLKEKTKHPLSQYFKINIVIFKHTNIYHLLKHWKTRQHKAQLLFP